MDVRQGTDETNPFETDPFTLAVRGEIDIATSEELYHRLVQLGGREAGRVVLDLSRVTFMDCAGLRALIAFDNRLRASGGEIAVAAVSFRLSRFFEILRRHPDPPRFLARAGPGGAWAAPRVGPSARMSLAAPHDAPAPHAMTQTAPAHTPGT